MCEIINFIGRSYLVQIEGRLNAQQYVPEIPLPQRGSIIQLDNARPHVA